MKMIIYYFIFIVLFAFVHAENNTFVFTNKMAEQCKEHMCRNGYLYDTFYEIDSTDLKEIRKDSEMALEMRIAIQATSNGHILLSPVLSPGYHDPVYEIVIGGGGNQFTELRRNLKRHALSSVKTPRILSTFEPRLFYIKISRDGHIELGKEGDPMPLISWPDVTPLDIKYFSFAAWSGVEARFLYDCPIPTGNGTEIAVDSQQIQPPLSMSDQLKRAKLMYRLPWIPPKSIMDVKLGIKVTSVKYDAFQTKLITAMSVVTSWTDESMAWFPDKYNGTTSLKFRQGQIWRPKFYVFNSDQIDPFDATNSDLISVVNSGEATFHYQTKVYSWCIDFPSSLSKWPHDEYVCSVVIQPWEAHEKISMEIMDSDDIKMKIFEDTDAEIENEWDVLSKQVVIKPDIWNDVFNSDDNQTHQSDRLFIHLYLKRRATAYNIVFYIPLLVLVMFVLLSFWSEPLKMERIWFYAGCTIVICMGLCYIDYLVPCHTLPSILVLYTVVLSGVLVALLSHVFLMTSLAERFCSTNFVQNMLTSYFFRVVCCLPAFKYPVNGGYTTQEDDDIQSTPIAADVEEMESDYKRTYGDKKELAEVIDRVFFAVYSITFAAMLAVHF